MRTSPRSTPARGIVSTTQRASFQHQEPVHNVDVVVGDHSLVVDDVTLDAAASDRRDASRAPVERSIPQTSHPSRISSPLTLLSTTASPWECRTARASRRCRSLASSISQTDVGQYATLRTRVHVPRSQHPADEAVVQPEEQHVGARDEAPLHLDGCEVVVHAASVPPDGSTGRRATVDLWTSRRSRSWWTRSGSRGQLSAPRCCRTPLTNLAHPCRCNTRAVRVSLGRPGNRPAPRSAEDDGLVAVEQDPRLGVPADGAGEHLALDVAAGGDELGRRRSAWSTRITSCSMIGPSSRSAVT